MSPIEHVWDLVGRRLFRDVLPAASKDELLLRIQAIWNSLPQADIQNLFDSMPRHIAILTAACAGYTKCWFRALDIVFIALKVYSVMSTNRSHLFITLHLILMTPSECCIFLQTADYI
ncbi:transposable element Tcb1 transposase [Trichonephila clavipes]|nr:transposable element Tcb1 transposase [Trichonephila clavipes]